MSSLKQKLHEQILEIRPHHGLCTEFFRGMGYSEKFAESMAEIIAALESENPEVRLTVGADVICINCPHNSDGICETSEKVNGYDRAVLEKCGLSDGSCIKWQDFKNAVRKEIISKNKLSDVCGDCSWYEFCKKL